MSKAWIKIRSRQNVGPDLGPKCLKRLSADDKVMFKFSTKLEYIGSISNCHNLLSFKQFVPLSGLDRMLGLIWVQIVRNGYQQMTMSCSGLMQS